MTMVKVTLFHKQMHLDPQTHFWSWIAWIRFKMKQNQSDMKIFILYSSDKDDEDSNGRDRRDDRRDDRKSKERSSKDKVTTDLLLQY